MDEQQALLEQLHALQAPTASVVPALGWWLVAALLGAILYAYRWYQKRYQQRYWYRQTLAEIAAIKNNTDQQTPQAQLLRCSVLARKLALVGTPRAESASVIGERWLQQLDSICDEPVFSDGAGKLLVQAPYQQNPTIEANDISELTDALGRLAAAILRKPAATRPHRQTTP